VNELRKYSRGGFDFGEYADETIPDRLWIADNRDRRDGPSKAELGQRSAFLRNYPQTREHAANDR
jgi:hypothetical protein